MFLPIWLFEERGGEGGSSFEQSRIPYSTIQFDILSPQNFKFPDTQTDGLSEMHNRQLQIGQQTLRTMS